MKTFYLYLIVPFVLLLAFLYTPSVGYFAAQKRIAAKVAAAEAAKEAKQAEEDRHRKEVEAKAAEDARERQLKREAEEKAKQEKREREYQDANDRLSRDIAEFSGEADKFAKEAAELDIALAKLRTRKESAAREAFELAKQVELAKIERRNAEIEIQRMVDMVAQRLNASPLSAPPAPPAPPPGRS